MSDIYEVRDMISGLRGDMREGFAELNGRIETLSSTRAGDYARLDDGVKNVEHDLKSTKAAVSALHDRVDAGPKRDELRDLEVRVDKVDEQVRSNQIAIAKAGGLGGILGAALIAMLDAVAATL